MDDEIEDIVGIVEYTDSQKSVATTNIYSQDFTDSSSDKNNSSGKDTYVIEYDSEGSDSELEKAPSAYNIDDKVAVKVEEKEHKITNGAPFQYKNSTEITSKLNQVHGQCESGMSRSTSTSLHRCSFVSQETFTQTSKTVLELTQLDSALQSANYRAIETQTSYVSIIKNKTVEYRFEVDSQTNFRRIEHSRSCEDEVEDESLQNDELQRINMTEISCLRLFPSNKDNNFSSEISTADNSTDMLKIIDEVKGSEDNDNFDNTSEFEDTSKFDSECDVESIQGEHYSEDKLTHQDDISETSVPISVDNDVEELYSNLKKSLDLRNLDRPADFEVSRYITLSPLTEESTAVKRESIVDITPNSIGTNDSERIATKDVLIRSKSGEQVKGEPADHSRKPFKLPPIHNQSCPSSLQLNSLFGIASNKLGKASTLPSLFDGDWVADRWEIATQDLASGESAHISEKNDSGRKPKEPCHLPSIYIEGHINYGDSNTVDSSRNAKSSSIVSDPPREFISIQEKIKDLKMVKTKKPRIGSFKYDSVSPKSRSISPGSGSPDEACCHAAERGCELLCQALLKRLQSSIWLEVVEVLDELPNALEKFWFVISEQRIADLIRQVSVHVDSPRTQVARAACGTLAAVLKNTNYTKKPDFFEAVTVLLVKTGSYSKPVRRAANVALDEVVTGVEPGHAVPALCVHGVSHKSALVRCAAARLLVVAAALAGGGRGLLRARPPSAAHARRLALRALAALLDDKNSDARKYAERLYSMLRPQPNFEAYYLTDVAVDTATKQMKKYDHLVCGRSKESR